MNTDVQTPSSRGFAGATTVNVVLDKLDDFEIVSLPDNPSRTISWCTAPPSSGKQFSTYDDRVTLYVVGLTDVDVLFMQHPHAMGLIVLQQDEPFSVDAPPFAPDLARKLVIVRSKIPGDRAKLQAIAMSAIYLRIFTTRKWADDLARIVARKGTVQEIIDASEFIFDNFIDVNDSTYSLVACTKNIEPVDPLSTELVRLGYHDIDTIKTADSIGAIEEWRDQKEVHVFGPDSIAPYQYVTSVLRSGNSYAGHVVMVCSNHDVTPGTLDLFKILSSACQQVVSSALFNESPTALFLRKVIDDARLTQAYLDEQSALLNLETRGWFSL